MGSPEIEPVFYDFEASSLDGYPIEIGWAYVVGGEIISRSFLIRPPPDWPIDDTWDEAAEELHGITRSSLSRDGVSPREICVQMNQELNGRPLYSDSSFDPAWLQQLFEATGLRQSFTVHIMLAPVFLRKIAETLSISASALEELERQALTIAPQNHRAEADARHLATLHHLIVSTTHLDGHG